MAPRFGLKEEGKIMRAIGRRIRHVRKLRGMNTCTLGRAAGVSQSQISRMENGLQGIRSKALLRMAKALKVSPIVFFTDTDLARKLCKAAPRRVRGLDLLIREE